MLRIMTLFAWATFPLTAALADGTSCWIQDACATGGTMWVLCQDGKILTHSEGGAKWREQDLPSREKLRAIRFIDSSRGFVAGQNGTLLATEDGGNSWRQVRLPIREHLAAIHSLGESVWIVGWGGVILHSGDGGRSWSQQPAGVSHGLHSVYFVDPMHGWAVAWVGTILRTTDGGKTWQQVRTPVANWSLNSVYFRDSNNGWAVGFGGQILRSRDGGLSWEAQSSSVTRSLTSVVFDHSNRGWITTTDGLLLSEDGGQTWQHVRIGDWLLLTKMLRVDGSLLALGSRGMLKQTDEGLQWQKIQNLAPETVQASGSASLTGSKLPLAASR